MSILSPGEFMKKILGLFFLITLALGCTKKNENEIRIGHFASMTGSEATFGIATDEGIRLAFEEINAAGGVKGKKLVLITRDDQGKPEEAASVATRLIEQDKVLAIMGEVASSLSIAVAPIAQAKKIPMLSPSSTNPEVTTKGDYVFRTCFIDPFQGYVMAKFATENLKLKKVAVMRNLSSDYSVGLANVFVAKFKELGGEIVADVTYQKSDVDFKAQLTQMKSKNPEGIYIPGYYSEVGLIARQARELGLKGTFMGGDGWDSPKLSEIGQAAVEGAYFSNHYSTESTAPEAIEFLKKFQAKYNKLPDGLSSVAYDAGRIMAKAIGNTANMTAEEVRNELAKIKDFPGATGKISIDENRNASKPAVVVQVQGKTNKYVTTINP